jgi:subtilisin
MNSMLFRPFLLCACFGAVGASFAADTAESLTPAPSDRALPAIPIPDRYIVQVAAGVDPRAVAATHGVSPNFVYQSAVRGFAGTVAPGRVAALRMDPRVLKIVPDHKVAAIGKPTGGGGGTPVSAQTMPAGVQRIGAASGSPGTPSPLGYTGKGVGVAVVDSGVDLQHADLAGLINGYNGVVNAYSAFGVSAQDNNAHGTHVAGIIAARNNSIDVVGVAPSATIYAVKVLDASGSGSDADVIGGLDWVVANASLVIPPIRVVNMSLGRAKSNDDSLMHDAVISVRNANIAVVVAAGNEASLEISGQVPSGFTEVFAIGSTTALVGANQSRFLSAGIPADTASYFTSDGAGVLVSAPGEDKEDVNKAGFIQSIGILSTKLGGGTTRMSGTSMAAPHVAGVVALIYEKFPSVTVAEVRARIDASASNVAAPLNSPTSSYTFDGVREGVLDAPGALVVVP